MAMSTISAASPRNEPTMKDIELSIRVIACMLAVLASPASAQTIDGTGALTGTVTAPVDYRAAQVYAMNVRQKRPVHRLHGGRQLPRAKHLSGPVRGQG